MKTNKLNPEFDFSILMLCKNQSRYVITAAGSVLEYDRAELILVDPGSTDETGKVVEVIEKLYRPRVKVIKVSDNGPAQGLNHALAIATGEYVGVLNGDDLYLPGALEHVKKGILEKKNNEILFFAGYVQYEESGKSKFILPSKLTIRTISLTNAITFFHQGIFFKRSKFSNLKFNEENKSNWDFEFLVDLIIQGAKTTYSNIPIAVFRIHSKSISGSKRFKNEFKTNRMKIAKKTNWHLNWITNVALSAAIRIYKFVKTLIVVVLMNIKRTSL